MRASNTSLPGVIVLEVDEHADARGSVREVYRADRFEPAVTFVQDNVAVSVRGALRGLHFRAAPQAKLVLVVASILSRASGLSMTSAQQGEALQPFCGALINTSTPVACMSTQTVPEAMQSRTNMPPTACAASATARK